LFAIREEPPDHSLAGAMEPRRAAGAIFRSVVCSAAVNSKLRTLLLVAALLAGCGRPNSSPPPTLTTSPDPPTESKPAGVAAPQVLGQADDQTPQPPAVAAAPAPTATATAPPPPGETPAPPPPAAFIQHLIQPGDTLLGLANQYGVSMAAIQLANGMGKSIDLIAGQTLSIPGSTQWPDEGYFWVVHVVQAGETLVGIAGAYDLRVDDILQVNAVADPALIHIDQQLVMPLTRLVTLGSPRPTAPAAAPLAPSGEALAAAAAPEPAAPPVAPPLPAPGMPAGSSDRPGYILARINQVRAEHGLNPLTLAPELTLAAQAHAEDCARRGWGSHVGSDGAVLQTRLERAGYLGKNWGENWVQALNAERAFEWWYGEIAPNDPHRRNILSPHYSEIGIGIAETGWGYIFVTDLGRR
jgi:uncharacterized protein YkwD